MECHKELYMCNVMFKAVIKSLFMLVLFSLVSACDVAGEAEPEGDNVIIDDTNNNGDNVIIDDTSNSSITDIVGVWDDSETLDNGEIDEVYLVIRSSGEVFFYDYDGDSFDKGANCYYSGSFGAFTSLGNANFRFDYSTGEPSETLELTIENVSSSLLIRTV